MFEQILNFVNKYKWIILIFIGIAVGFSWSSSFQCSDRSKLKKEIKNLKKSEDSLRKAVFETNEKYRIQDSLTAIKLQQKTDSLNKFYKELKKTKKDYEKYVNSVRDLDADQSLKFFTGK